MAHADLIKALRAIIRFHEGEARRHDEACEALSESEHISDQHEADMHDTDGETHRIAAGLIRDAIADRVALIKALGDQPDSDPPIPNSQTHGA